MRLKLLEEKLKSDQILMGLLLPLKRARIATDRLSLLQRQITPPPRRPWVPFAGGLYLALANNERTNTKYDRFSRT
jgi:hypothetical protein